MAKATEETTGASIKELTEAIKDRAGKEVEPQNLRATLRNLVKKGQLTHEPRSRWEFSEEDVQLVVDHYAKGGDEADKEEAKKERAAKKATTPKKAAAKKEEAPEPEVVEDDEDDLEIEDI